MIQAACCFKRASHAKESRLMRNLSTIFIKRLLAFSIIFSFSISMAQTNQNMPKAPVATKLPKEETTNGDKRIDDYFWLRERKNPEVLKYLEAENAYAEAFMKPTEGFSRRFTKRWWDISKRRT